MKDPVDHILRPQLPWRSDGAITECGYNAEKVSTLTRAAYFERKKDLGQQRCAMLTCMTCARICASNSSRCASISDAMAVESNNVGHGSKGKRPLSSGRKLPGSKV